MGLDEHGTSAERARAQRVLGAQREIERALRLSSDVARERAARHERRSTHESFGRWRGLIVGRFYVGDLDDAEYALMRIGGNRRRLRVPDGYTRDGAPHFVLSERDEREARRLLDRACAARFEIEMPYVVAHNMATNSGRGILLSLVANVAGLSGVTWFAVGNGAGTPSSNDTALWAETFRKQITLTTQSGNQVDLSTNFGTADANGTYTECGIFGNGANSAAGSGVLFAHAPYPYNKTASVTLTNDYYISLS